MPGLPQSNENTQDSNNTTTLSSKGSISVDGFWSHHHGDVSYNQLQKFWSKLSLQARQELLKIDKQCLFEQARKNMYCSRCNGLLNEGFLRIVMYGKSLLRDGAPGPLPCKRVGTLKNKSDNDLCIATSGQDDLQDPSVHPWGGLITTKDGILTLLDCFQYEVSHDTVQADWHQTFLDTFGTYHHFEWAVGSGEGKSDILEFENVGLSERVQVNNLDLSGLNACYITLRTWKKDGRFNELSLKANALKGQQCVHCMLVVGDGFVTITGAESIRSFLEHAEEDDDSIEKDGNDLNGECSCPQKHGKSPELAREFLLDATTIIFREQIERAFREGTVRQNAYSMFVSLALKLMEEHVHVACKEIIRLEKQTKLPEEEENEKCEEEERKERRKMKEKAKKLRRKERLKEKDKDKNLYKTDQDVTADATTPRDDESNVTGIEDIIISAVGDVMPSRPVLPAIEDEQVSNEYQ